jgi:hypothetical protein
MLTIVLPRSGKMHIVVYKDYFNSYHVFCNKRFAPAEQINTLTMIDRTKSMCGICLRKYEEDRLSNHKSLSPIDASNVTFYKKRSMYRRNAQSDYKFMDYADKMWEKLYKYQTNFYSRKKYG